MNIFERFLSIKNDKDYVHKNITFLNMTIKIKRKAYRKIKFTGQIQNWGVKIDNDSIAILGNGPSLRETFNDTNDYKFIANKDIFVVNSFMQDEQFFILKPKYLCLMDPCYWTITSFLRKDLRKALDSDYEQLKKVNWYMIIFMPTESVQNNIFKKILNENKYIRFKYINTNISPAKGNFSYNLYKENLAVPQIANVLVATIYIAINLGYKNIFLYGADHSWHLSLIVNENNIPCIIDKHFYDKESLTNYIPLYKVGSDKDFFRISEEFQCYAICHKSYEMLEEYSQAMGATIYNLSKFSCIDAFRRKLTQDKC